MAAQPSRKYWVAVAAIVLGVARCSAHHQSARPPVAGTIPSPLAFTNAIIVDVQTGQLQPGCTVVVTGNRIAAAGSKATVRIPLEARVIDVGGRYVIPGLTDTHVHFLSEWTTPPIEPSAYLAWILAGGVTSVREMSPDPFARSLTIRADSVAGRWLAPRIHVSAGPVPAVADPWAVLFDRTGTRDAAQAIRKLPALGVDGLKLQNFPRETMLGLVAMARAARVPVYGHTVFNSGDRPPERDNFTLDLVRAGLEGVVHSTGTIRPTGLDPASVPTLPRTSPEGRRAWRLRFLTAWQRATEQDARALIAAMVTARVWYEPTRLVDYYWNHQDLYETSALPSNHPWRTREQIRSTDIDFRNAILGSEAAEASFIKRFFEAGGMILAGTDDVPFPPFGVSEEMRLLVDAGLPPVAALQAATMNAARAMRRDNRVGTIDVGKLADMVLLDANPLEDITNVRRIHAVIADGRFLDRRMLDALIRAGGR